MAYCVANDWLHSAQTKLRSTTVTVTPIVIATLTTSVTNPSITPDTTSIASSTPTTESISLTEQAATPAQSVTSIAEPTSTSDGDNTNTSSGGMSTGAKAGIGVVIALLFVLVAVLLFLWRKRRKLSSSGSDEEHTIPELGSGDKSNRHELDSYIIPPGAEKINSETGSNQQVMAELDGTPCASPRPEIERYEDRPPVELGGTSPEVMSVTSQSTSALGRGTNIAQPMIGDHINSNSSEPSLPSTAELEHLLHEEQLLRERRRTLEQLKQIQEDELALGEHLLSLIPPSPMKAFLFTAALAIRCASAVNGTTWRTKMPYCAQYYFVTGGDSLTDCQLGLDDKCICTESTDDVLRAVMKTCVEIKWDIWPIFAEFCVAEGYLDSSETALPSSMTATADPSTVTSAIMTNTPSTTTSGIDTTELTSPAAESNSSGGNDVDASSSNRLSPAAKAGIAIGATLPIIVGAVLLALWRKGRKGISPDKDGETAMPELGSGDNANRHELGPEAKLFGTGSTALAELESGHVMAELDGPSCLVFCAETNNTGDETRTTAKLTSHTHFSATPTFQLP
ncbi:hypothetical protein CGCSCA1_v013462 [Colletotrichum siamense]|nr:hypothetical protein CGCSCA1_v013462 [Colletotrichum siamense]